MDDLDDLLKPGPLPPEPPGLRATVTREASRVARRRRWLVRGRRAALLAACYAAGLATMWYWVHGHQLPRPEIVERDTPPLPAPPAPAPPEPPTEADPYRNDPPERLERWAFVAAGEKRVALYRRAGDGYLDRNDVQGALRCYRRALDAGSPTDLAIRADTDSWLLMSLKVARQKERPDARVN
jgi:hypothetical protein